MCLATAFGFSQGRKQVDLIDFSETYTGKIFLNDENAEAMETNCTVHLYDKKTGQEVFSADAFLSEYDIDPKDDKAKTNVLELPYGEQSILIFEDFNFDGTEDLALRTGFYSCYGGPSYAVYLAVKNGFEYSESFSDLGQNYCGMFQVNEEKKELTTMTKSGCCWHQYATYVVENNKAVPVEIIEESYSGMFLDYTVSRRKNGKMMQTYYQSFETENNKPEYAVFFENGKKMYLMQGMNNDLYYVFTDRDDKVELAYNSDFTYDKKNKSFYFQNKDVLYNVSEKGIIITEGKRRYHIHKIKEIKGSFEALHLTELTNVRIK